MLFPNDIDRQEVSAKLIQFLDGYLFDIHRGRIQVEYFDEATNELKWSDRFLPVAIVAASPLIDQ
jgi:hypothetical protein